MLEQMLQFIQGPKGWLLLFYFLAIDLSALNFILRIILTTQVKQGVDELLEQQPLSLFACCQMIILLWGYHMLPAALFAVLTGLIYFICFVLFGLPVGMVFSLAYKRQQGSTQEASCLRGLKQLMKYTYLALVVSLFIMWGARYFV